MNSTKLKTIGYWTTTGLVAFAFGPGAIPDLIQAPAAVAFVAPLGYPAYFDLTGAAISHAATGNGVPNVIVPLVLAGIAIASWALRPESRSLAAKTARPAVTPARRPGAAVSIAA
jgi:hypothetical protein